MPDADDAAQPWLANKQWASGRIAGSNGVATCIVMWVFALFWCAISGVACWMLFVHLEDGGKGTFVIYKGIFGIGFPAVGVLFIWMSVCQTLRILRYGRSYLTLENGICGPGDTFQARIECGVPARLEAGFDLELRYTDSWTTGSGKNQSTHTETLWSDDYECSGEASADQPDSSIVPVRFQLPADAQCTGPSQRGRIAWTLSVTTSTPGIDFSDSFTIPVFRQAPRADTVERQVKPPQDGKKRPVQAQVRIEEDGSSSRCASPWQ